MSIVIATLVQNKEINIFADRRMIEEEMFGSHYKIHETQKIYKFSDTILFGMTGDAEWGIQLANTLSIHELPSQLIQSIKRFNITPKDDSTFILGGKYDDGDLFLFGYMTKGGELFRKNESECIIASSNLELSNACADLYLHYKEMGYSEEQNCIETIKFAASQEPKYISEEFNHFQILY